MNNNEIMNNEVVEATEEVIENAGLSKAGNCKHQSPDRAEEDGC